RCTIGGMVANNACGSHSVAYGTAAENLISVTIMLASGEEITFDGSRVSDEGIDKQLHQLVDAHAELIDAEQGRCPRHVSGDELHYLVEQQGCDAAEALDGKERAVGVIIKRTVKLVEVPKGKALAVLAFETEYDAAGAAARLRLPGVATIEGV